MIEKVEQLLAAFMALFGGGEKLANMGSLLKQPISNGNDEMLYASVDGASSDYSSTVKGSDCGSRPAQCNGVLKTSIRW